MSQNDGGPAFPAEAEWKDGAEVWPSSKGMSLRDWFAGQALLAGAGINPHLPGDDAEPDLWPKPAELAERRARWAYIQADALIAARDAK